MSGSWATGTVPGADEGGQKAESASAQSDEGLVAEVRAEGVDAQIPELLGQQRRRTPTTCACRVGCPAPETVAPRGRPA